MLSNCCNAEIIEETDICSECKEHCTPTYTSEDLDGLSFEEQIALINSMEE